MKIPAMYALNQNTQGGRCDLDIIPIMGKKVKNSTIKLKTRHAGKRKNNKASNLAKKKKLKHKVKENKRNSVKSESTRGDLSRQVSYLCNDLKTVSLKSASLSQTQAVFRAKKLKEQKNDAKEMNRICKRMKKMLQASSESEEEEEEVAVVENLASNIKDLLIEKEPYEKGFRFSKRQQQSFHDSVKKQAFRDSVKKQVTLSRNSDRRRKYHRDLQ